MPTKPDLKLTRRQATNTRAKLALKHARIDTLIESAINGVANCETCKEEIKPFKLDKNFLDTIKLVYQNSLPGLRDEDFDVANEEHKSTEVLTRMLADNMSNTGMVKAVVKDHVKEALACRDLLIKLLPIDSKVTNIKAVNE